MKASDKQVSGSHYRHFSIQPSQYIHANGLSWPAGNIVKYASRAGRKGGREGMLSDLRKIIHYAELWIEWESLDAPPSPIPADPAPRAIADRCDAVDDGGPRYTCSSCSDD